MQNLLRTDWDNDVLFIVNQGRFSIHVIREPRRLVIIQLKVNSDMFLKRKAGIFKDTNGTFGTASA